MQDQSGMEKGSMKANTPGFCFSGRLIIMEMATFMKGLAKSTTRSLSAVMVSGAMAMSAFWWRTGGGGREGKPSFHFFKFKVCSHFVILDRHGGTWCLNW